MKNELNPFVFSGRISRVGFVCTTIVLTLFQLIINMFNTVLGNMIARKAVVTQTDETIGLIIWLLSIAIIILCGGCGVKRLRDAGKNPWWILLGLIPVISFFFWFYLAFAKPKFNDPPQPPAPV